MTGRKREMAWFMSVLFFMCVTMGFMGTALAEGEEFRLDIDDLKLQKGVSTQLVFSIINDKNVESISIDGIEKFDVLSTGQSSSTEIINGNSSFTRKIVYTIMPKEIGEFKLKGYAQKGNKQYPTNEVTVKVVEREESSKDEGEDIFIKTGVSDEEVFFGEKIALEYELYTRYNLENYGFKEDVDIPESVVKEVPKDKLKGNYTYINDKKYVRYDVKKMYIYPIRTGDIKIPSYSFQANISTGDFFSTGKPVYLQTEEKDVKVKPLPKENKPENFSGIVGRVNAESQYTKKEVAYGDSLTLKVSLSGECNLDNIKNIIDGKLDGFAVYESVKSFNEDIVDGRYTAQKDFEVILVPDRTGKLHIDPIKIPYFDTESETYRNIEIPGSDINVTGEMKSVVERGDTPQNLEAVEIKTVSYHTPDKDYINFRIKKTHLMGAAISALILAVFAVVGAVVIKKGRAEDKNIKDIYSRGRSASDKNSVVNAVNEMIKYRYGVSIKASSKDMIVRAIEDANIRNQVLDIIDKKDEQDIGTLKERMKEIFRALK